MLTAICGINWGDEGKGRMVDLLSQDYDIVVRYQGGNNAGHTVVNDQGKFILNLMPSGILRPQVVNIMGNGMVIDLEHLCGEIDRLKAAGVAVTPDNLKISDKAVICMPYHKQMDTLEEARLGDAKFGSTQRGIGPVYGDKYLKKALRMGDLLYPEATRERLAGILEWKNLALQGMYQAAPVSLDDMDAWLRKFGAPLTSFVCDTGLYLDNAVKAGRGVMFEAQLGALRDIEFGIYPYTSSSSTIAAYAPVGAGIPNHKLDQVIGIMKAYSTCVGEGPFTVEMSGKEAEDLRTAGREFGAATGRPRRVGGFDVVASRYGVRTQGADMLAVTKMDVLSYLDRIPVCIGYRINGYFTEQFPMGSRLEAAEPVFDYLDGWCCDISGVRKAQDLPQQALAYVRYLERAVDCPIRYVSVGAQRDAYIEL